MILINLPQEDFLGFAEGLDGCVAICISGIGGEKKNQGEGDYKWCELFHSKTDSS